MALVVYNPLPVLEHFHTPERKFQFAGIKDVTIKQDWNQYGVAAVVWEAAVVLGTFLTNISVELKDRNVLELGAGTGLTGIVASLVGANVMFTDRKDSLEICMANVRVNLDSNLHNFKIQPLSWGQQLTKDWSHIVYDYIIGADLVYIEETFGDLVKTFMHFSNINPDVVIYLSGKLRYKDKYKRFLDLLENKFIVKEILFLAESSVYILKITVKR